MHRSSSPIGVDAWSEWHTVSCLARARLSSKDWHARGWKINTAVVERLNLDFRQHIAAIGRRVNPLCTHEAGLRHQLTLFQTYHNVVWPHASLRLPLPQVTHETASVKRWQQRTPAMAAGLTNWVWSLREVLMCRVPPWLQPQAG